VWTKSFFALSTPAWWLPWSSVVVLVAKRRPLSLLMCKTCSFSHLSKLLPNGFLPSILTSFRQKPSTEGGGGDLFKQFKDKIPPGVDQVTFESAIESFKGNHEKISEYINSAWEGKKAKKL